MSYEGECGVKSGVSAASTEIKKQPERLLTETDQGHKFSFYGQKNSVFLPYLENISF